MREHRELLKFGIAAAVHGLTAAALCVTIPPLKLKAQTSMISLSPSQPLNPSTAHGERVLFALAPRLDASWRGFYFGYFSSHRRAPHAQTDPTP